MNEKENAAAQTAQESLETIQRRGEAVALHSRIMADYQAISSLLTEFCGMLKTMRDKRLYRELGHDTFDEYVEKQCGIRARQAYTYISTYEKLGAARLEQNAGVGITKLSILAQMYPADADEVLAGNTEDGRRAEEMSARELQELVEKANHQGEQLSMLSAEKADAENQEAFYRREMERAKKELEEAKKEAEMAKAAAADRSELARQLADARNDIAAAKQAAHGTTIESTVKAEDADAIRDAAKQAAAAELNERLADAKAAAEKEMQKALRAAEEEKKAALAEAKKKADAEAQKAAEAAEKKAAAEARKEAMRTAEEEKKKAVAEAIERGKAEGAAEAEKARQAAMAEAEKLRRQMETATDAETIKYMSYFDQLQSVVGMMLRDVERIAEHDAAKAEKLRSASVKGIQMQAQRFEEEKKQ